MFHNPFICLLVTCEDLYLEEFSSLVQSGGFKSARKRLSCRQMWVIKSVYSLRKIVGKVSPILITLTSLSDSDFESSNVSLKEDKTDGVNPEL